MQFEQILVYLFVTVEDLSINCCNNSSKCRSTKHMEIIFLLKISYKNFCVNFDAFSRQNGSFIFPQNRGA